MDERDWLLERFEAERAYLRAVAYRILGSVAEAEDAVQEAWVRVRRADPDAVDDLRAWLTTIVARVALNGLRARSTRRETSLDALGPEPLVSPATGPDPEQEALLGDAVGLAMLVILDTLTPAERIAFVLHDVFAVPFEAIAPVVGRTPAATRQLASRGRRRVRRAPLPDTDLAGQWRVVDAFLAAARDGDFDRLLTVLDPDVTLRSDGGPGRPNLMALLEGAEAVAQGAMTFRRFTETATRVLIHGIPGGIAWTPDGRPFAALAFVVRDHRIVRIDVLADPDRLARLDLGPIAR